MNLFSRHIKRYISNIQMVAHDCLHILILVRLSTCFSNRSISDALKQQHIFVMLLRLTLHVYKLLLRVSPLRFFIQPDLRNDDSTFQLARLILGEYCRLVPLE